MSTRSDPQSSDREPVFESEADAPRSNLAGELLYFLKHQKKWWMLPLLLLFLLIAVLVILGGTGAAPFIYTLF
jgi:hypothetical protein